MEQYLEVFDSDESEAISKVRDIILDNSPDGFEETMNWGMICYEVPLVKYPNTYNKNP